MREGDTEGQSSVRLVFRSWPDDESQVLGIDDGQESRGTTDVGARGGDARHEGKSVFVCVSDMLDMDAVYTEVEANASTSVTCIARSCFIQSFVHLQPYPRSLLIFPRCLCTKLHLSSLTHALAWRGQTRLPGPRAGIRLSSGSVVGVTRFLPDAHAQGKMCVPDIEANERLAFYIGELDGSRRGNKAEH
eukprot:747493-Hanusia_phi.AAC.2